MERGDNEGRGIGILNELLAHSDLKGAHLNNIITDLFLAATDTVSCRFNFVCSFAYWFRFPLTFLIININ